MKKNILISVCIAICGITMLSFIEILKTKNEVRTENKCLTRDTTVEDKTVQTGAKHVNTVTVTKKIGK